MICPNQTMLNPNIPVGRLLVFCGVVIGLIP
jgi:hypothetical protein